MPRQGYVKKPASFCAKCGDQVTNAGRASRDGKRYCQKRVCQAAKAARHRQRAAALRPDRDAPTACTGCGAQLTPRPYRAGDETGRWCRKVTCRRKRDEIRAKAGVDQVPDLVKRVKYLEIVHDFLRDVILCDDERTLTSNRVVCKVCGLTSAIPSWVHPAKDRSACMGTIDGMPLRVYGSLGLVGGWPSPMEYLDDDQLAALNGDD